MSTATSMKIGELGTRANVPPKTIRYYEERGLLPEPQRLANGYRVYGEDDARRLEFIRSAQAAGLSLQAVSELLDVVDEGEPPCCLTRALAHQRIEEIDRQIQKLERLRERVMTLLDSDTAGHVGASPEVICPLIGV